VAEGSVVMKHEQLLPGQDYAGAPTRPLDAAEATREGAEGVA
jgi:hypothetical protein